MPRLFVIFQLALYLASWASFILFLSNGNPGPYIFITTLETHVAVPAPLGQFIPIVDVTTNFYNVHSWFLSPLFMLIFGTRLFSWTELCFCVSKWNKSEIVSELLSDDTWWWSICSIVLGWRAFQNRTVCSNLKQSFLSVPGFPSDWFHNPKSSLLLRLPGLARCHPFLLQLTTSNVNNLAGSVCIREIDITPKIYPHAEAAVESDNEHISLSIAEFQQKVELEDLSIDVSTGLLNDSTVPLAASSSSLNSEPLLIDIWTTSPPDTRRTDNNDCYQTSENIMKINNKPVFLFLHGGGWLGGSKRMHSSVGLLLNLAARGWLVVSVGYRKQWPLHIQDALVAYSWVRP